MELEADLILLCWTASSFCGCRMNDVWLRCPSEWVTISALPLPRSLSHGGHARSQHLDRMFKTN